MNWSMEHVYAPSKYFEFLNNHLSVKGRAIIAVPNYKGLIYRLSPNCVELPIHLYHFSEENLRSYSKKYNLEITSSLTFSYPSMFLFANNIGLLPFRFSFPRGIIFSKNAVLSSKINGHSKKYLAKFSILFSQIDGP